MIFIILNHSGRHKTDLYDDQKTDNTSTARNLFTSIRAENRNRWNRQYGLITVYRLFSSFFGKILSTVIIARMTADEMFRFQRINVLWTKENGYLPSSAQDNGSGTLRLIGVQPSDSGVYICTANDGYSSFSDKKTLRIIGTNIEHLNIIVFSIVIIHLNSCDTELFLNKTKKNYCSLYLLFFFNYSVYSLTIRTIDDNSKTDTGRIRNLHHDRRLGWDCGCRCSSKIQMWCQVV